MSPATQANSAWPSLWAGTMSTSQSRVVNGHTTWYNNVYTWSCSISWCLAEGYRNWDQHHYTGQCRSRRTSTFLNCHKPECYKKIYDKFFCGSFCLQLCTLYLQSQNMMPPLHAACPSGCQINSVQALNTTRRQSRKATWGHQIWHNLRSHIWLPIIDLY